MKITAHDPFRTFDYIAFMTDVYYVMVDRNVQIATVCQDTRLNIATLNRAFTYASVSLPTLLLLASWADLNLMKYIVYQD